MRNRRQPFALSPPAEPCSKRGYHADLFARLSAYDLPIYWEIIERKYLKKYRLFLRMEFEWSGSGLVRIDYPGAVSIGVYDDHEILPLPKCLSAELWKWVDYHDNRGLEQWDLPAQKSERAWKLEIAKNIGRYLPDGVYFEARSLRQIVPAFRQGVELDYDPDIQVLLRLR
jgi:hypothetical protein